MSTVAKHVTRENFKEVFEQVSSRFYYTQEVQRNLIDEAITLHDKGEPLVRPNVSFSEYMTSDPDVHDWQFAIYTLRAALLPVSHTDGRRILNWMREKLYL